MNITLFTSIKMYTVCSGLENVYLWIVRESGDTPPSPIYTPLHYTWKSHHAWKERLPCLLLKKGIVPTVYCNSLFTFYIYKHPWWGMRLTFLLNVALTTSRPRKLPSCCRQDFRHLLILNFSKEKHKCASIKFHNLYSKIYLTLLHCLIETATLNNFWKCEKK